ARRRRLRLRGSALRHGPLVGDLGPPRALERGVPHRGRAAGARPAALAALSHGGAMNKAWLLMALVALCGCPEGWRLERVEGERPSVHPEMWKDIHDTVKAIAKEAETDPACARYREPLVHCAASAKWKGYCRRSPDCSSPVAPDTCSRLKSMDNVVQTH